MKLNEHQRIEKIKSAADKNWAARAAHQRWPEVWGKHFDDEGRAYVPHGDDVSMAWEGWK